MKNKIAKHLWLSAANPGAKTGHKLVAIIFGKYVSVPVCGNLSDESKLVTFLGLKAEY
jgi:hypothetical protein